MNNEHISDSQRPGGVVVIEPKAKWSQFNMNECVRVKPTELGKKSYVNYWKSIMTEHEASVRFDSKLDRDGFMVDQLWCIIAYFGEEMSAGLGSIHANEFYLETAKINHQP